MKKRSTASARKPSGTAKRTATNSSTGAKKAAQGDARTKNAAARRSKKKSPVAKKKPRVLRKNTQRVGRTEFPKLSKVDGVGARIVVAERVGGRWDESRETIQWPQKGGGAGMVGRSRSSINRTVEALAAVAHVQRLTIMLKLLDGPATYAALTRATKLKAGPLYHHIGQLRLAGLILPKQRDLYELTRGGRNLMLAVAVVGPVTRDRRRRPVEQ